MARVADLERCANLGNHKYPLFIIADECAISFVCLAVRGG
jgi:hypothetical protein